MTFNPPCYTPALSFHSCSPISETRTIISNAFKRRGLVPSTSRDKRCIFQWAPRSRVTFNRAHSNTLLTSSFFINQGLTHKDRLFAAHSEAGSNISWAVPKTYTIPPHATADELIEIVCGIVMQHREDASASTSTSSPSPTTSGWILKQSQVNNALGLVIFQDLEDLVRRLEQAQDSSFAKCSTKSVLQEYVVCPLLLNGCKFHLRVNVLVTGGDLSTNDKAADDNSTTVTSGPDSSDSPDSPDSPASSTSSRLQYKPHGFVHRDIVAHVATENYIAAEWDNRWIHVTNHGVQKEHPRYDRSKQTLSLLELETALVNEYGKQWLGCSEHFLKQASTVVREVLSTSVERPGDFRPMSNSFELFGFDFLPKALQETLVEDTSESEEFVPFRLQLLEVNGGPALEGVARPDLCLKIVEDVMKIVVDPFLKKCYKHVEEVEEVEEAEEEAAEAEEGTEGKGFSHGTEFVKVWERGCLTQETCEHTFQIPRLASNKMEIFGVKIIKYLQENNDSSEED